VLFTYVIFLTISGVGLSLNGMNLTNNSIVTMTDIGTGAAALACTTKYRPCCTSANQETQWYFPNGNPVPNDPALPYQRTRRSSYGRVILSRNSESTTTGIFHCVIPVDYGVTQSLYVGIYNRTTGESCILCVFASLFQFICKEVSGTPVKHSTYISSACTLQLYTILLNIPH